MPDKFSITDIPIGREHSVSRAALAQKWGVSDRVARRRIAHHRMNVTDEHYAILSTSHGDGYWRSNDPQEIADFERETIARAKSTFASLRMAQRVRQNINQTKMAL